MTASGYIASGTEVQLFEHALSRQLPVMLTGPTGCGKTRLVEHVGERVERPVVTISCHDDLTSSDLVGRFLVSGGDVVWQDGPLTRAVRDGAICYLDEVVEYNPAYRSTLKELKPSFRQRFVTLDLDYLAPDREADVLVGETGIGRDVASRLVRCASSIRSADAAFHLEPPSTRTLVNAAHLVAAGVSEAEAVDICVLGPLSTDGTVTEALREITAASLPATTR
jgi:MoxR-like ATPase